MFLLSRELSGEASASEARELHDLLSGDAQLQELYATLHAYWQSPVQGTSAEQKDALSEAHFQYILQSADEAEILPMEKPARIRSIWIRRFSIAALIAGISFGIYYFLPLSRGNKFLRTTTDNNKSEVLAKAGVRSKLVLPDGTKVWLNSASKLSYSNTFNDAIREVELDGEAFFDVVKKPKQPFIVHTSGIDIKVLGTAFNVKSYSKEKTIEATLIRGSIEVVKHNAPKSPKVILEPHEKLVFQKESNQMATTMLAGKVPDKPINRVLLISDTASISITHLPRNLPDSALKETSWMYNKLNFDGDNFHELAAKMERWFNIKISFKNEKITSYRFRGAFENENIEQALQALQLTAPFNYQVINNEVLIYKR